jgi:prepilin-type N-terminal cleavage/methylation domain-containing protein
MRLPGFRNSKAMPHPHFSTPTSSLRRTAAPQKRAGFTLVELLVVIGILAIIAGTVIVAFDDAGRVAGDDLTRQRMAAVREALLRVRADMGYFPGQGPLAADKLDLSASSYDFVDGSNPEHAAASSATRAAWAAHDLNLWQLFEKPKDKTDAKRWEWNPDAKHGWNGPYLGAGFQFRLDDAGTAANYMGGARLNRLRAVADAFERSREISAGAYLRWNHENGAPPAKSYLSKLGQPLIFERLPVVGGPTVFTLVSMGPDGRYDDPTNGLDAPDYENGIYDLRLEVSRERN